MIPRSTRHFWPAAAALLLFIGAAVAGCSTGNRTGSVGPQNQPRATCGTVANSSPDALVTPIPAGTILTAADSASSISFRLPPEASQGPSDWYVLKLSADLSFGSGQPTGASAAIIGDTNGRVSHQIELERRTEGVRMFWSGLLGGSQTSTTPKPHTTITFDNYLQVSSVKPGSNTLRIRIDQRTSNLIRQVTIRPGSGIFRTSHPPEQLKVQAPQSVEASAWKEFAIPYTLTRASNREDTPTNVSITAQGLNNHGGASHVVSCIGAGTSGNFTLDGPPGDYLVRVTASGDYNKAISNIDVHIAEESRSSNTGRLITAALLLFAAVCVARWRTIHRKASRNHQDQA